MGITLVDGYGMPKLVALTRNKHTKDLPMTTEKKNHPHLQELIDGLPLPDGRVLRAKPEVLAAEKAFFESLEASEQSTAAPPSALDPGLLEGLKFCLEDAERALDDAKDTVENARDEVVDALRTVEELKEDFDDGFDERKALGRVFGSFPDMPLPDEQCFAGKDEHECVCVSCEQSTAATPPGLVPLDEDGWDVYNDLRINNEGVDLYAGGGQTLASIQLDDAYYTIKRLLDDSDLTNQELIEFGNAVERLIRK
jgi:hypothetical protein